ncbi:MAG: TlpA family protein disulfide reductase [Actinomycetota bacterium]|nr:TlpA family protein disulfide reductase [Actinomycetota bacterium]
MNHGRRGRRTRLHGVVAALLPAMLLAVAGCSSADADAAARGADLVTVVPTSDRKAGPRLAGPTLDGSTMTPDQLGGKVVVVNMWASWCGPCRKEAPDLAQVDAETADEDVAFVGLNIKDRPAEAKAFLRSQKVSFPSISPGDELLLGFGSSLPAQAPPVTWVLDREGRVAARVLGAVDATTLRGLVDDVLAEDA